ncbi:MAG: hypothetical protein OXU96_00105 [Gammaproteobacteria bacterium]|nr:hypothetical protein [Gammaproteobacteria bacterium]
MILATIGLVNTLANPEQKVELQKLMGLLLGAQKEALALQEENRELKEQIKSHDRFE